MSAIASYPGTVTPLRGLSPFSEAERDVLFGRDRECDDISRLLIGEGFRAGLLHGAPGVGKTSLLRAGVLPYLRDHGVVVLVCDDLQNPIRSFVDAVVAATGLEPADNERPLTFLARVVGQSLAGQLYLFIIDEVDELLQAGDDRLVGELGDLFARVVARSGGRARFLFSCASERVHLFGELERRTGSLFPPSARYELQPFSAPIAADVLERTLAYAGGAADPALARAIIDGIGPLGPVLPADLQIAMVAIQELGISDAAQLEKAGGASELTGAWLSAACRATGHERSGLRLLGELAATRGAGSYVPEWAAARASLDPGFASHALEILADRGVVRRVTTDASEAAQYALAHEILAPRVREVSAPARASARRAFELLGSKTAQSKRLSIREWWALRREGIQPSTPAEQAILKRTKRTFLTGLAAIAAAPLLALAVVYIALSGSYHLDVAEQDGTERVVVRAGNPTFERFYWLPSSPRFGAIVADTGLTRSMASQDAWRAIEDGEVGQNVGLDRTGELATEALRPGLQALVEYAADGSDRALGTLRRQAGTDDEFAEILEALAPIARGGPQEVAVVEQALGEGSPAVRSAALGVAIAAETRHRGVYRDLLAGAIADTDDAQRRLALSAVRRGLDEEATTAIVQDALASGPEPSARRELFAVVDREDTPGGAPSPGTAISLLASEDIDDADRDKARNLLRRAFLVDSEKASRSAAALAANSDAPEDERIFALELLQDQIDEASFDDIADDMESVLEDRSDRLRAAALPVYARIDPADAAGELALMLEREGLGRTMREAMALAWGEVVSEGRQAAHEALDSLLDDDDQHVRAAAARAYGNLGRASQTTLIRLIGDAPFRVEVGAAYGLATSATQGGSGPQARGGIGRLWAQRGSRKRAAAEVYAHMAHESPDLVLSQLSAAARDRRDDALHPIGIEGLCNGVAAGSAGARQHLIRATRDPRDEVKPQIVECALDHAEHGAMASQIARLLADDEEAQIRAAAARVLASVVELHDEPPGGTATALLELATDASREVRLAALDGLAIGGAEPPEGVPEALTGIFDTADEAEKLAILEAARATGAGALAGLGLTDDAPRVRIAAMATALGADADAGAAVSSAVTDPDATVRRAAVVRLAEGDHDLPGARVRQALAVAVRDEDPEISMLALTTLARTGDVEEVRARLERMLVAPSERQRARAAEALAGLGEREPAVVRELLEPRLRDPAHDVRAASLAPLAAAYAATLGATEVAELVADAEMLPTRRIVGTAALVAVAEEDPEGAERALEGLVEGPPMARESARIGRGLIAAEADGLDFLARLVP